MKTIHVKGGVLHLGECLVECPHCMKHVPCDGFLDAWYKSKELSVRKKCKGCKRFFGITSKINGDFIAYALEKL